MWPINVINALLRVSSTAIMICGLLAGSGIINWKPCAISAVVLVVSFLVGVFVSKGSQDAWAEHASMHYGTPLK